jgi:catechol 2,3-dioxygenase-like lactoylglutathione lyase family enzyme
MSLVGIHHAALIVQDLPRALAFYAQAAGLQARATAWGDGVLLAGPNALLHLRQGRGAPPAAWRPVSQAGITHVCLQSTSMPSLQGHFAAAGAGFHGAPVDLGTGFLYCYARDPEGNVVELEGVAPVWDDPTPWLAHVSISTPDLARMTDFYSALFACSAHTSATFGPNRRLDAISGLAGTRFQAAWLPAGNLQLELIQYLAPATLPAAPGTDPLALGYSHMAIEVQGLAAALSHALACGAATDDTPCAPGQAFVRDPDGNRLLLIAWPAGERTLAIAAQARPHIVQEMASRRAAPLQPQNQPENAA